MCALISRDVRKEFNLYATTLRLGFLYVSADFFLGGALTWTGDEAENSNKTHKKIIA